MTRLQQIKKRLERDPPGPWFFTWNRSAADDIEWLVEKLEIADEILELGYTVMADPNDEPKLTKMFLANLRFWKEARE